MKVSAHKLMLILLCSILSACSTFDMQKGSNNGPVAMSGGEVGGSAGGAMDDIDRNKMFHALDNPPGKSTHWVNGSTGISYTVTPIKKTTVGDNKFCREYQITKEKNANVENSTGTACVGADGSWKSV